MLENVVSAKLIASGNVFEFFLYDDDVYADDKKRRKRISEIKVHEIPLSLDDKLLVRRGAVMRAARNLRRIINSNVNAYYDGQHRLYKSVFITLTFAENMSDIERGNAEFLLFIKRLNYYIFNSKQAKLKYCAVLEFQKRGALHYHVIFFNLPYIVDGKDTLEKLWGNGFVDIISIDDVNNVGSYVVKYMVKDFVDERLMGFKCYQASQKLFKPYVVTDFFKIAELLNMLPQEMTFGKEMESDFVGKFRYVRADLDVLRLSGLRYINPEYVYKEVVDKSVLTSVVPVVVLDGNKGRQEKLI